MKKLFIVLLFIPFVSFGQTVADYVKSGFAKFELKDYYGAISDYTKSIELNPNENDLYNFRGNAKFKLKDYYGAISDYTKAIELDPNDKYAYTDRGLSKYNLRNLNGACADWKKAAELGSKDAAKWVAKDCN